MSCGIDVDILLYASDEPSPLYAKAAEFLGRCAAGREVFYLTWPTPMGTSECKRRNRQHRRCGLF